MVRAAIMGITLPPLSIRGRLALINHSERAVRRRPVAVERTEWKVLIAKEADDIISARSRECAVECDDAPPIAACQTEQVMIGNLFSSGCRPDFGQHGGRYRVRPPFVTSTGNGQHEQAISR